MKFSLLLSALSILLKLCARFNSSYRRYIHQVSARVLIKTEDDRHARLFIFDKGRFSSRPGLQADFDVALVWKTPEAGFSTLTSTRDDASMVAMAEGDLRIVGMSAYALWFETGIKKILGRAA